MKKEATFIACYKENIGGEIELSVQFNLKKTFRGKKNAFLRYRVPRGSDVFEISTSSKHFPVLKFDTYGHETNEGKMPFMLNNVSEDVVEKLWNDLTRQGFSNS